MADIETIDWSDLLGKLGVESAVTAKWAPVFADTIKGDTFDDGIPELCDFLGQILHESSMLSRMEENLNYSADRIRAIGNSCAPGSRWNAAAARADSLAGNPIALANFLYGGRFGNTQPGDGFKFRARSPLGITFSDNYAYLGNLMGQDLTVNPDLLAQPHYALEGCIHWWNGKVPDDKLGDLVAIRRIVNGGELGLADTVALTDKARQALA